MNQTMKDESNDKFSFEKSLNELQTKVKQLEAGELSLEESLRSFEEGVKLLSACHQYLGSAEQTVEQLVKSDHKSNAELKPFTQES